MKLSIVFRRLADVRILAALGVLSLILTACSGADASISGRLPDGSSYELAFDPELVEEEPEGVFAALVLDLEETGLSAVDIGCSDDPCVPVLGIAKFALMRGGGSDREPSFENGVYSASSGDWTMTIEVYDHILEAGNVDVGQILMENIQPVEADGGLPAFELSGPLRWATDHELPLQMEVSYRSFVVRRGCDESSVGCSAARTVQVIPTELVYSPAPQWDYARKVTVSE